jgi:hypothetical protein
MNNNLDDIVMRYGDDIVKDWFYDMSSLMEVKENLIGNLPSLVKWAPWLISKTQLTKYLIWWGLVYWWSRLNNGTTVVNNITQ